MKHVVIVGGGFAGLSAARVLSRYRRLADVTLVSRFENIHFKPLLPDMISGTIPARYMVRPIDHYRRRYGFRFIPGEVHEIDPNRGLIRVEQLSVPYDFLILATGSEANFYGNDRFKRQALKLDDRFDGDKIAHAVALGGYDTFVISGGGYTGVEIASHIRKYLEKKSINKEIYIVELADSILGPLPDWMKDYTSRNLQTSNINILLETKVQGVEDRTVSLSDGRNFSNALLIWSTGMKAPEVIDRLDVSKEAQGRISVDAYLRFKENAYAIGNTGCYKMEGGCPRMAAQTAVRQGVHAAGNIIRSLEHEKPVEFKPVDFGYFVPMANGKSCGIFLGRKVTGATATFLHYLISAYRSHGIANKWGVISHGILRR